MLTREQSTQHHVKRHAMWVKLTVGADADGHLLALRSRIVADAGGYHTTSAKCALRAACHSCGVYRVPNVDVEAKAVYTNNPNAGAMRGFGSNQAQFAMEGVMDMLAEKVGVDGWDIRERNILNPGDKLGTGQVMRESARGIRETLNAVKDVYKSAKYKGIGCGIKSTGLGNGTIEGGHITIRVVEGPRLEILNGYTEMGQGVYTATMQAVCEETGLPADIMTVAWDKELGEKCGETWASRGTTLSCAAAQQAARKLAADLDSLPITREPSGATPDPTCGAQLDAARRPRVHGRVRLQLHDEARHAGSRAQPDDAPDVQLRGAGRHPGRSGQARTRRGGQRRGPRDQPAALRRADGRRRPHGARLRAVGELHVHRRRPRLPRPPRSRHRSCQAHARSRRHPDGSARRSRRLRREGRGRDRLRRHGRRGGRRAPLLRRHPPRQAADGRCAGGKAAAS